MNKTDIVKKVAADTGLSQPQISEVFDSIIASIGGSLEKREDVRILGFGTFYAGKRKAYDARNPKTGDKIKIKACHIPKFRPGKSLKEAVR